jgi:deoxyribose-phosphate aldolase
MRETAVPSPDLLARVIDHTLLKPHATSEDIKRLCREALEYGFYSVCVNPAYLALCAKELKRTPILPITVVGFPLGANVGATKVFETAQAVKDGAREIDMVINIGALKDGDTDAVMLDIAGVVGAAKTIPVKVILETAVLTDAEKRLACRLSVQAGAACVKTSTGFAGGGATVKDVKLMRAEVGDKVGVKASGGIRTLKDALGLLSAGATRLGLSASVEIMHEFRNADVS